MFDGEKPFVCHRSWDGQADRSQGLCGRVAPGRKPATDPGNEMRKWHVPGQEAAAVSAGCRAGVADTGGEKTGEGGTARRRAGER